MSDDNCVKTGATVKVQARAMLVFQEVSEPDAGQKPAAVAPGRKDGLKGGKARAEKLTPEQRSEIAKRAAQARLRR